MSTAVDPEMQVEDLVRDWPQAVSFLRREYGVSCLQCGEPLWGTLREAIEGRKLPVDEVMEALRRHLAA